MSTKREQFLLFRIRAFKDEQAFTTLFCEHKPAVFRFLCSKLPSTQDAEDALNVTFIRVWNYLGSSQVEHLSGLIYTIARGVVADHYRSIKMDVVALSSELEETLPSKALGSTLAQSEIALMKEVLGQLNEDQQQVVILRHFEGHSIKEIAKRMGKTEGATSIHLHRTMKRLRELLQIT